MPMPHQQLMPGMDADTVMEDMVDTGMAVMDVDTAMDTAVDTVMVVMVVTDTADTDITDKKLIVPYLQRNINTKLCHYTAKPSDYTLQKQHDHRCLLKKTLLKQTRKNFDRHFHLE